VWDLCLFVKKQESVSKTSCTRYGKEVPLHNVAKGRPFTIVIGSSSRRFKFQDCTTQLELLYDKPDCVPTVKEEPLSVDRTDIDNTNNLLRIVCRVHVLTSQSEGRFFRIRITVKPKHAAPQVVYSEPIRTTSKKRQAVRAPEDAIKKVRTIESGSTAMRNPQHPQNRALFATSEDAVSSPGCSMTSDQMDLVQESISRMEQVNSEMTEKMMKMQEDLLVEKAVRGVEAAFAQVVSAMTAVSSDNLRQQSFSRLVESAFRDQSSLLPIYRQIMEVASEVELQDDDKMTVESSGSSGFMPPASPNESESDCMPLTSGLQSCQSVDFVA
jgi:hypothetical protein